MLSPTFQSASTCPTSLLEKQDPQLPHSHPVNTSHIIRSARDVLTDLGEETRVKRNKRIKRWHFGKKQKRTLLNLGFVHIHHWCRSSLDHTTGFQTGMGPDTLLSHLTGEPGFPWTFPGHLGNSRRTHLELKEMTFFWHLPNSLLARRWCVIIALETRWPEKYYHLLLISNCDPWRNFFFLCLSEYPPRCVLRAKMHLCPLLPPRFLPAPLVLNFLIVALTVDKGMFI